MPTTIRAHSRTISATFCVIPGVARKLRAFEPGTLIEVTLRTLQGRLLLRPSALLCEIILGILGRAQSLYGLEIQAFVFLSNHYHLICRPADPKQLASFMRFVNSKLAREVGRLHGWREKVWGDRYHAIAVSDEPAAQIARLKYLLSHGCKEGFVITPGGWPGVHCVHALLSGIPLVGTWFDRTREYRATRGGRAFGMRDFSTPESVHLSPLPCWEALDGETYRERIAELVREIEETTRATLRREGRRPAGASFILRQDPATRPAHYKRSPAPLVHAASQAVRRAFVEAYRIVVLAYRRASERLRAGDRDVEFPRNCFPPPLPFSRGPLKERILSG